MSSPHRSLAARFRTAVRKQKATEDRDDARQRDYIEEAHRSREELLDQLEDFAESAEFFEVSHSETGILLKYEGRRLRFELDRREPIVHVRGTNIPQNCNLIFHPSRRVWQVVTEARRRRETIDLFPNGLERLIVRNFEIRPALYAEALPEEEEPEPDSGGSRFWR